MTYNMSIYGTILKKLRTMVSKGQNLMAERDRLKGNYLSTCILLCTLHSVPCDYVVFSINTHF